MLASVSFCKPVTTSSTGPSGQQIDNALPVLAIQNQPDPAHMLKMLRALSCCHGSRRRGQLSSGW